MTEPLFDLDAVIAEFARAGIDIRGYDDELADYARPLEERISIGDCELQVRISPKLAFESVGKLVNLSIHQEVDTIDVSSFGGAVQQLSGLQRMRMDFSIRRAPLGSKTEFNFSDPGAEWEFIAGQGDRTLTGKFFVTKVDLLAGHGTGFSIMEVQTTVIGEPKIWRRA